MLLPSIQRQQHSKMYACCKLFEGNQLGCCRPQHFHAACSCAAPPPSPCAHMIRLLPSTDRCLLTWSGRSCVSGGGGKGVRITSGEATRPAGEWVQWCAWHRMHAKGYCEDAGGGDGQAVATLTAAGWLKRSPSQPTSESTSSALHSTSACSAVSSCTVPALHAWRGAGGGAGTSDAVRGCRAAAGVCAAPAGN